MFPSPSNTVSSNQRLFNTVGARTLLHAPEADLDALLEATRDEINPILTPSYAELMHKDPAPKAYALSKSFEEAKDVTVLGLHTSGTSGHPKPIYWTHGSIAALASARRDCHGIYPDNFKSEGKTSLLQEVFAPGEVVMMPFPLYHVSRPCDIPVLPYIQVPHTRAIFGSESLLIAQAHNYNRWAVSAQYFLVSCTEVHM